MKLQLNSSDGSYQLTANGTYTLAGLSGEQVVGISGGGVATVAVGWVPVEEGTSIPIGSVLTSADSGDTFVFPSGIATFTVAGYAAPITLCVKKL